MGHCIKIKVSTLSLGYHINYFDKTFNIHKLLKYFSILSKRSSAQMGFGVNPVLARNSCIQCYISLFTEIILQQVDAFKIEIQGTLTKL